MTFGVDVEQSIEKFDLDEDEPLESRRHNREASWTVVKSLGEHWSVGTMGEAVSSSFENTKFRFGAAPAVEYNFFPYSAYTRRQLRTLYWLGPIHSKYYEVTLFDKLEERYGVQLRLQDLFLFGTPMARLDNIESAINAGQDFIDEDLCDHYAFRQGTIDWQIWISSTAGKPLPRKIVITNRADEARPQSISVSDWTLKPSCVVGVGRGGPRPGA